MNRFKKIWYWIDDRTGISELIAPMAKHLVPSDSRWAYVFGSATLIAFVIQVITGIGLAFMYQPSSGAAYDSLKFINSQAPLGHFLRGIHYFGSSAMILLIGIHMIRVYIYASYKYPREMSWISGVILLVLTLGMGFTGQLLRWDNNGVWSAIVGAEQAGRVPLVGKWVAHLFLGGDTIGGTTLSRFFAFHVFLFPALLIGLIGLHVYLVIRNGISEPPKAGRPVDTKTYRNWYHNMLKEKGVPFWPNAAWRDMAFGLLVIVAIILLGYFVGAPEIGAPPDPSNINATPRPDWYFMWIFAMFALMPRNIETFFIAYGPVLVGLVLFALPFLSNKGERSPIRRPWSIAIVVFIVTIITAFWYEGNKSAWSPDFSAKVLPDSVVNSTLPDVESGSKLFYTKACLYCHSISGQGGHRGPDLTKVGERLTESQITIRIVNGGGNMPAYGGTLSQKELKDLVSFLKSR
jgi:ubiquinol-cytochrome c reductase cytochrome b subunit